jgi:hypothetical protein
MTEDYSVARQSLKLLERIRDQGRKEQKGSTRESNNETGPEDYSVAKQSLAILQELANTERAKQQSTQTRS